MNHSTPTPTPQTQEKERQALSAAAVRRISASWPDGVPSKTLESRCPIINGQLVQAETKLNAVWSACQLDLATMDEFRRALKDWEAINYQAAAALKALPK